MVLTGGMVPEIMVKNQNEEIVSLAAFKGQTVVVYFYPKDATSGCTKEACAFRDNLSDFNKLDCVVLGVSPDSVESHRKFINKEGLTFDLLADTQKELCEAFGVWKEKSMYGRKYMGVERSTFVINPDGEIVQEWRKVKVKEHVETVLRFVKSM